MENSGIFIFLVVCFCRKHFRIIDLRGGVLRSNDGFGFWVI